MFAAKTRKQRLRIPLSVNAYDQEFYSFICSRAQRVFFWISGGFRSGIEEKKIGQRAGSIRVGMLKYSTGYIRVPYLRSGISGCFAYFWVYPIFQASQNMRFSWNVGYARKMRWPDSRWFSKLDRVGSVIGKMSSSRRVSGTRWSLVILSDPPSSETYQELRVRDSGSNVHCWRSKTNYRV